MISLIFVSVKNGEKIIGINAVIDIGINSVNHRKIIKITIFRAKTPSGLDFSLIKISGAKKMNRKKLIKKFIF